MKGLLVVRHASSIISNGYSESVDVGGSPFLTHVSLRTPSSWRSVSGRIWSRSLRCALERDPLAASPRGPGGFAFKDGDPASKFPSVYLLATQHSQGITLSRRDKVMGCT